MFSLAVNISKEPAFYSGQFYIDKRKQIGDTYISLSGWSKGVVAINDFTLGRFWPVKYKFSRAVQILNFDDCYSLFLNSFKWAFLNS